MSTKKWEILDESYVTGDRLQVSELLKLLLRTRGITTEKAQEHFLNPQIEDVRLETVEIDKKQVQKAIGRIKKAIRYQEQIVVFGDYDVDGITASAILWETLTTLGASVMPYIPDRVEEGYGLSAIGIDRMLEKYPTTKLIITVDNGIVANKAVDYANKKQINVIITDHHMPSTETAIEYPDSYATIHTTKLCGAGIAWLFAEHIKGQLADIDWDVSNDNHIELAALGTIADLVPLTGANRTIVTFGLKKLHESRRIGLLALLEESGCDPKTLGVYEIGHVIAPRLNAAGRLASAMDSLRLLCTKNSNRARELASLLGRTNKERQQIMFDSSLHASTHIKSLKDPLKKILFVADEIYQQGVIGLVAGRLVEEYYRPAIVVSKGETHSKASVRSVSGFNIIQFLRLASDLLVDVGGHPMAAGFTVETKNIDALQKKLEEMADVSVGDDHLIRRLRIDCELPLSAISQELYQSLMRLSPFGMGNPEPTFVSRGVTVEDLRFVGKEKQHLKLRVASDFAQFDAIAFGMGERGQDVRPGDAIHIVYTVDENVWNGKTTLQLKVKDFKKG